MAAGPGLLLLAAASCCLQKAVLAFFFSRLPSSVAGACCGARRHSCSGQGASRSNQPPSCRVRPPHQHVGSPTPFASWCVRGRAWISAQPAHTAPHVRAPLPTPSGRTWGTPRGPGSPCGSGMAACTAETPAQGASSARRTTPTRRVGGRGPWGCALSCVCTRLGGGRRAWGRGAGPTPRKREGGPAPPPPPPSPTPTQSLMRARMPRLITPRPRPPTCPTRCRAFPPPLPPGGGRVFGGQGLAAGALLLCRRHHAGSGAGTWGRPRGGGGGGGAEKGGGGGAQRTRRRGHMAEHGLAAANSTGRGRRPSAGSRRQWVEQRVLLVTQRAATEQCVSSLCHEAPV